MRWLWVLALASAQMICLLAALTWYGRLLHQGLTVALRGQVAAVNSQVVGELAEFIGEMGAKDRRPTGDSLVRLQSLVERIELPNEGHVSIVDSQTGAVVCHPALGKDRPGRVVNADVQVVQDTLGKIPPGGTVSGWVELPDGIHHVTIRDMPEAGLLLVADQPDDGIWAAVDYVSAPLWSFGVAVAVVLVMLGTMLSMGIIHRYENALANINSHLEQTIAQRSGALVKTRDAIIFGLAKLADSRDSDTGEHLDRVHEYIAILAKELAKSHRDIDDVYTERLKLASSLHDIGKVGIRDDILLKPGKLTGEERKIMQTHGEIGARCLAAIQQRLGDDDFLEMAREINSAHHERWDGLGYPKGLRGEEIPLSARIVAVVDVYDALTTHRVYRAALSHEEATDLILTGAGTQFDPAVVEAFHACIESIREVALGFNGEVRNEMATTTEELIDILGDAAAV